MSGQRCHLNHQTYSYFQLSRPLCPDVIIGQVTLHLPSLNTLYHQFNYNCQTNVNFNCKACQCNKSHKLPFFVSSLTTTFPPEIVFFDVWTSLIMSIDDFKYYVIFVDHFVKYVWFYPLKRKSQVDDVFGRFKSLVENNFQYKIITLYSNNGGEYQALSNYLATNGVWHLTSPPTHTITQWLL